MRFLVWLSGPAAEARTAPWWELPLNVSAPSSTEALAKAVAWAAREDRLVDRMTATPLGEVAPAEPMYLSAAQLLD